MGVMKKSFYILVVLILGSAVTYAAVIAVSDTYRVKLAQHTFNIPKQYSREGGLSLWFAGIPGLDDGSRAYLLEFPAEELAEAIPGYQPMDGRYREDITAILNSLRPVEVKRYKDSERYRDLWEATGSYQKRIVEPYSDRPWFKVYREVEYPYSWTVTTRSPDGGEPLPENVFDFWIAHCLSANSPITESGKSIDCDSYVFYDDIAIDFGISEQNLHLVDEVRAYLKSKIESWKVE
ncbi:MAG TPA: hypothetical protein VF275_05250 [Gammaproteobacteria bacterium]